MKKKISFSLITVLLMSVIWLYSCKKNSSSAASVSPSNPNALTSALVIPNATVVNSPTVPASSASNVAPAITRIDNNISYSAGSQIIIPLTAMSHTTAKITGVYIQVKGATTYFNVPLNGLTASATYSLPINLPSTIGSGNFVLILEFYDAAGNVSVINEINVTVTQPSSCGVNVVSGGEGITSKKFKMSSTAGAVKISYDTYTVPDKIDVFQNSVWIGGTGPSTQRSTLTRALSCAQASAALGYVGKQSEFNFNYDPSAGQEIEVVISGCENGGTAWEYTFSCPTAPTPVVAGKGNYIADGVSYSGTCISTVSGSCTTSASIDVSIIAASSNSLQIHNMPTQSSGTYPFVQYTGSNNCALYTLDVKLVGSGLIPYSATTGSLTKTGAKSFTFTETYKDQNGTTHSFSGSGSY